MAANIFILSKIMAVSGSIVISIEIPFSLC